jgi:hypothetical protein
MTLWLKVFITCRNIALFGSWRPRFRYEFTSSTEMNSGRPELYGMGMPALLGK